MTIAINIGGDNRTTEDKVHARTRRMFVEAGILVPTTEKYGWNDRPCLTPELVKAYRTKLITLGILIPSRPW